MKKTFKMMMAAVMTMAMVGFVACSKDDDKKTDEPQQQTYEESTTFEILYHGQAVAAGTTVEYTLTQEEINNDDSDAEFFVKNKTNATVQRVFKVELTEGPASMGTEAPICYGVCEPHNLPYTSNAVDLAPGTDDKAIQIHLYPSFHEGAHTGTYKITVGKGANLEDPQVCFVKFNW